MCVSDLFFMDGMTVWGSQRRHCGRLLLIGEALAEGAGHVIVPVALPVDGEVTHGAARDGRFGVGHGCGLRYTMVRTAAKKINEASGGYLFPCLLRSLRSLENKVHVKLNSAELDLDRSPYLPFPTPSTTRETNKRGIIER